MRTPVGILAMVTRWLLPNRYHLVEIGGVVANLAYTWMYLRGRVPEAYLLAACGGGLLGWACWAKQLQAEALLHGFYILMAGYGAWFASTAEGPSEPAGWGPHLASIALASLLWMVAVPVLRRRGSAMPQLDAFTTLFSVVATWWMVRWDATNWLYWIVIDAVSVYLYAKRGMPWGALLFLVYTAMAVYGWLVSVSLF